MREKEKGKSSISEGIWKEKEARGKETMPQGREGKVNY